MARRGRRSRPFRAAGGWRFRFMGRWHWARTEGEAWSELHDLQAAAGVPEPEPDSGPPLSIAGLVERWVRAATAKRGTPPSFALEQLGEFVELHGAKPIDSLTTALVEDYARHLWTRPDRVARKHTVRGKLGRETVRKRLSHLSALVTWGIRRGWLSTRPDVPRVAKPTFKPKAYTTDELGALFASLVASPRHKHFLPLVRFILETGARPGEARTADWSEIDMNRGAWTIPEHKVTTRMAAPRPKIIPLSSTALSILRDLPGRASAGPVFRSYRGTAYTGKGFSSILKRRGWSIYRLRHTWCQAAADAGIPYEVISDIMGHTDSEMIRHYVRVADERRRAVAAALDGLSLPPPPAPSPTTDQLDAPAAPRARTGNAARRRSEIASERDGGRAARQARRRRTGAA